MRKREREDAHANTSESGKGDTEGLKDEETAEDQYEGLTPYEIQRAKLIARNRRRMIELGIPLAISQLKAHIPSQARKRSTASEKRKKPDVKEAGRGPGEVRRSKRLKTQAEGPDGEEGEVDPELQKCIGDGQCPRCGRKLNQGYGQHLERCSGAEEKRSAPRRAVPAKTMEERLAQLELSGLIDMSDDEAQFVVIGSTGNHYMVTLAAQRHKCQCVDHRIRKHDCKHIKLCLKNIGAPDGNNWRQALHRSIEAQEIVELDEQDAAATQVKRGRSGSKAKTKKAGAAGGGHGETKAEPGAASPADVPQQADSADGNTEQQAANQEATVLKAESASGMAPTARTSSRIRARAAAPSTALKFL